MGNKGDWESAPTSIIISSSQEETQPWVFCYFIMLSWKSLQASDEDWVIAYKRQVLLSLLLIFSISITAHRQHYQENLFSGSAASCRISWPLTSHRGLNMSWPRETGGLLRRNHGSRLERRPCQQAHSCLRGSMQGVWDDSEAQRYQGMGGGGWGRCSDNLNVTFRAQISF